MNRIAVTGLGAISALGASIEDNWQAVAAGRGGIARCVMGVSPHGPGGLELPMARVADGYEAALDAALGRPVAGGLDPFARFVLAPALEALETANTGPRISNAMAAALTPALTITLGTVEGCMRGDFSPNSRS